MIVDKLLVLAEDASVSATASGSTVIDCGQAKLTTGLNGMPLAVVAVVTDDFADDSSSAAATVTVELQDCATSNGSFVTCASSAPVLTGDFNEKAIIVPMPLEHKQYVKVRFVVAGTLTAAGKVSAFITDAKDAQTFYAEEDGAFQ